MMGTDNLWQTASRYCMLFAVRFLGAGVQALVGWLTLHFASASDLGFYYVFVAWTLILGWVLSLGIPEQGMRMISVAESKGQLRFARDLAISCILTAVSIGPAIFILVKLFGELFVRVGLPTALTVGWNPALLAAGSSGLVVARTVAQLLKGRKRIVPGLWVEFVIPFIPLAAGAFFAAADKHSMGVVLVCLNVLGFTLSALIGGAILFGKWSIPPDSPRLPWRFGDVFQGVGKQWIAVGVQSLFLNMPTILVSNIVGNADAGIFGLGVRIAAIALIGSDVIISLFGPRFAALNAQGDMARLKDAYYKSQLLSMAFALPALIVVIVMARPILSFFGHQAADQAIWVLRLLILGRGVYAVLGPVSYFFWMVNRHWLELSVTAFACIILLVTGYALGQSYGAAGIAAATVVATTVRFGTQMLFKQKFIQIPIREVGT